jgi:hypothetical protein
MFKRLIAILACGLTLVPCLAQTQAAPSGKVKVSKGVILRFANLQPIDSATAKEGDQVPLKLVRSVVIDGVTVLSEGELVYGRVTRVKRAGKNCRNGSVKWNVDTITFPDSTQAKAHIFFVEPGDVPVPDMEHGESAGDIAGDIADDFASILEGVMWFVMLSPLLILFFPAVLDQWVGSKKRECGGKMGHEYLVPENSTVAVAISKDYVLQH